MTTVALMNALKSQLLVATDLLQPLGMDYFHKYGANP